MSLVQKMLKKHFEKTVTWREHYILYLVIGHSKLLTRILSFQDYLFNEFDS